jgi:MFS superfamily sulfate permease-like transporter
MTPSWTQSYRADWLRADVVAGLIAAAVVLPKAMAYATIAGLPVEVGLYTAFLPVAIYGVLGQSRVLSVSTTTTIAILAAAPLGEAVPGGEPASLLTASATLTLLVGLVLVVAAVLRLGFVADFISTPVLVGFKTAIGLVIVVDKVPKLLGVHVDKGPFFRHLVAIFRALPETSAATLSLAVATIVILVAVRRFLPRAPAPLIAIAAGIGPRPQQNSRVRCSPSPGGFPCAVAVESQLDVHHI